MASIEVGWNDGDIPMADFVYAREFMLMRHNYFCGVCKTNSAVQETHTGVLQPCWECQKFFKVIKLNWFTRWLFK